MFESTRRHSQLGQTIVEVIIATAVVAIVLTTVVAVISVSVRNTARANAKALATKYTQEGIEYFRAQKNLMGWETFVAKIEAGGPSSTYCLATLPYSQNDGLADLANRPCTSEEYVDDRHLYKRSANVSIGTVNGQQTVTVLVDTTWLDGDETSESMATVQFQKSQH